MRLAWGTLYYTLAVIVWGAYVRATGSGAGCGDHWPLCNGTVVPRSPELTTIIEFSHRVSSGLSLLLVVGLAVAVFRRFPKRHLARPAAVASVVFIFTEALIGAGLVLLGLVAQDQSLLRAWSLTLHLVNTFLLLAALVATAYWSSDGWDGSPKLLPANSGMRWRGWVALMGTVLVAMSGGIAALGDTLFPSTGAVLDALQADFSSASHWLIRLRIWHPIIAVTTSLFLIYFGRFSALTKDHPTLRKLSMILVALVGAQITAGLLNVALLAPVWLQLVHLLLADALWVTLVLLILASRTEQRRFAIAA